MLFLLRGMFYVIYSFVKIPNFLLQYKFLGKKVRESDFIDIDVAVHDGIDGEGADALHAQLVHDVLAVGDDGGQADVQAVGYFLVDISLHDERHDLDFAVGEYLLLQDLGHGGEVLPVAVGMLYQHEELTDELGLGLVDAEGVEVAEL